MMRISYKFRKEQKLKNEKSIKILKMQSIIIFKTIHKKMTASGHIIHSILITSLWTSQHFTAT